jgi:hypothetical protein
MAFDIKYLGTGYLNRSNIFSVGYIKKNVSLQNFALRVKYSLWACNSKHTQNFSYEQSIDHAQDFSDPMLPPCHLQLQSKKIFEDGPGFQGIKRNHYAHLVYKVFST